MKALETTTSPPVVVAMRSAMDARAMRGQTHARACRSDAACEFFIGGTVCGAETICGCVDGDGADDASVCAGQLRDD